MGAEDAGLSGSEEGETPGKCTCLLGWNSGAQERFWCGVATGRLVRFGFLNDIRRDRNEGNGCSQGYSSQFAFSYKGSFRWNG